MQQWEGLMGLLWTISTPSCECIYLKKKFYILKCKFFMCLKLHKLYHCFILQIQIKITFALYGIFRNLKFSSEQSPLQPQG